MSVPKYHALAGEKSYKSGGACDGLAKRTIIAMDGSYLNGCIYSEASWLTAPGLCGGLVKHNSDELYVFLGLDPGNPENLNAEISFQIENDVLSFTENCCVFVPGGAAHGNLEVKSLKKPVYYYNFHIDTDTYEEAPAVPTAAPGVYAGNCVERYEPVDGKMPSEPEGYLTPLLWIDGNKLNGAPYMEATWINTVNYTGPTEHNHDFDEFIGFFGADFEDPDSLGGEVGLSIDGETFYFTKSCLIFIPCGVMHCPIHVAKMERQILHLSGGNGDSYIRKGAQ